MKFVWVRVEDNYNCSGPSYVMLSGIFEDIEECRSNMHQSVDEFIDKAINEHQSNPDLFHCKENLIEIITESETVEWSINCLEDETGTSLSGHDQYLGQGNDIPSPFSINTKSAQQRQVDLIKKIVPADFLK